MDYSYIEVLKNVFFFKEFTEIDFNELINNNILLEKNLEKKSFVFHTGKNCSNEFDIPFDRQSLADYLNVDRSALSNELSKMTEEGLLETRKSHFLLKKII